MRRQCGINLCGEWTCGWLEGRCWEEPPLQENVRDAFNRLKYFAEHGSSRRSSPGRIVIAQPYSEVWHTERDRLLKVGDHMCVRLMDDWATQGKGWTCVQHE
jgi:hypothetical protein